jgi:hypothetical protein
MKMFEGFNLNCTRKIQIKVKYSMQKICMKIRMKTALLKKKDKAISVTGRGGL